MRGGALEGDVCSPLVHSRRVLPKPTPTCSAQSSRTRAITAGRRWAGRGAGGGGTRGGTRGPAARLRKNREILPHFRGSPTVASRRILPARRSRHTGKVKNAPRDAVFTRLATPFPLAGRPCRITRGRRTPFLRQHLRIPSLSSSTDLAEGARTRRERTTPARRRARQGRGRAVREPERRQGRWGHPARPSRAPDKPEHRRERERSPLAAVQRIRRA